MRTGLMVLLAWTAIGVCASELLARRQIVVLIAADCVQALCVQVEQQARGEFNYVPEGRTNHIE